MKPETVTDPVCGMTIDPKTAAGSSTYNNETFHFCAASCKTAFDAAPEKFTETVAASCCTTGHSCC